MKLYCDTKILSEAVNIVSKAVSVKSNLPHLEGILLEAFGGILTLTSNNLEISIKKTISANISEEGKIVLNCKMFSEILRKLPEDVCEIMTNEKNNISISCLNSDYKIAGLPADEFPQPPEVEEENHITIKSSALKDIIDKTLFAVSLDNTRKIFTGSLYEINDNNLTVVSIDGYRLALVKNYFEKNLNSSKMIIPGKSQGELAKILKGGEDNIEIYFCDKYVLFEGEGIKFTSRLIEGEFFAYKKTIPAESKIIVKAVCREFLKSVERVEPIIDEVNKNCVRLKYGSGKIIIRCETVLGTVCDSVECDYFGEEFEIGFNYRYLHDAASRCKGEEIQMSINSPINPMIMTNPEDDSFLYLVLPVKL